MFWGFFLLCVQVYYSILYIWKWGPVCVCWGRGGVEPLCPLPPPPTFHLCDMVGYSGSANTLMVKRLPIHRNRNTQQYPLQVNTSYYLFSNLDHVSSRQNVKVRSQGTRIEGLSISHVVQLLPKEDVVLQCGILDPSLLGDISHTTLWENSIYDTHWKY